MFLLRDFRAAQHLCRHERTNHNPQGDFGLPDRLKTKVAFGQQPDSAAQTQPNSA
jgi:hypothetical protein